MNSHDTPTNRDEPAQVAAVRSMVKIGRAREALDAALHHLHAAMAVTPVEESVVAAMGQTAERLAGHLREHRERIGLMYEGARVIDARRAQEGGSKG